MAEKWRLIRSGPLPGALNMALDEALLQAVAGGRSRPVLRLYRWQPSALTLGYSQPAAAVEWQACRRLGVEVVRRPTGGRAVLHDRECTYAVIAPAAGAPFPGGIAASYREIAGALRLALAALGLPAELAPGRRRGGQPGICFVAPATSELVYRGCKVTGSAQKRQGQAFLQHGSIPVDLDLERLWQLLDPGGRTPPREGAAQLALSVGWLNRWLQPAVTISQVEEALPVAFAESFGVQFEEDAVSADEWAAAQALAEEKYGNEQWTKHEIEQTVR